MARKAQGQWLIRIEDIDPLREIKGIAQNHIEVLKAFGMESDETIFWQSRRYERYEEILQNLMNTGEAFECFCSRKDLMAIMVCIISASQKMPKNILQSLENSRPGD